MTKELTPEEMDRRALQAISGLERLGQVMDVFNKFHRQVFKLRGGMDDDDSLRKRLRDSSVLRRNGFCSKQDGSSKRCIRGRARCTASVRN